MKRLFVIFLYVFAFVTAAQAQQWKQAMEQYNYSKAIELMDPQLDSLLANEPQKLKELLLYKATCQKNLYKFTDAITTLDEALQTGGEDVATYASIAECHRLMGNDIAAYMFYENAVSMAYGRMKDYENAMKYYSKYLKVGKQGSAVWKFVEAEMAFIKEELFMKGN